MLSRLQVSDAHRVLEPCAGEGHFIDAVLKVAPRARIDAYEANPVSAAALKEKYSALPNVRLVAADAVLVLGKLRNSKSPRYDRIIGNPPYGAWQDYSRRRALRKLLPALYVRETYGLFLHHCINALGEDGRLVFILPDTFLYLHLHEGLRRHILESTLVDEVAIFPSRFFEGISFGYANMAIISLVSAAGRNLDTHIVRIIRNLRSPQELSLLALSKDRPAHWETSYIRQAEVADNARHAFVLTGESDLARHLSGPGRTIGDIADVVTGFYSGDDRRWFRPARPEVRGAWRYRTVNPRAVASQPPKGSEKLGGISRPDCFIPIVKGGAKPYVKPTEWYVDWSVSAVKEYRKPKPNKARFQNSHYYFREGIAVPMVSSKRVTAALLEGRLFDQSIVGIFPHDPELVLYLLGFFNSSICTRLLRIINPSANNSANYVKRLPYVPPSDEMLAEVSTLVNKVVAGLRADRILLRDEQSRLDMLFDQAYCQ